MRIPIHYESSDAFVILAAGGVIERQTEEGIKIAIIRRQRYGTEWSLPKGKLESGETLTNAARREIKEETGCTVILVRFLATDSYQIKEEIKSVYYWLCHIKGECQFKANEEVKELVWLSPKKAISRLTHVSQQNLIRDIYLTKQSKLATFSKKLAYIYSRYLQAKLWKRLSSTLAAYRVEYRALLTSINPSNSEWELWIRNLLKQAEAALMEGDIDKGWKCFHAARRIELLPISDPTLLMAKAEEIRIESEKLNKGRRDAVNSLLPKKIQPTELTSNILFDAALIRDEHYTNQAYKQGLRRGYHLFLGVLLFLHIGLIYFLLSRGIIKFDISPQNDHLTMFIGVVVFGLLGAIFSAILKSFDIDVSARIPETALAIRITILRIVLGAGSAVILYFILISQLLNLLNADIVNSIATSPISIYVLAIAAGFSERLVLNALKKVNKE